MREHRALGAAGGAGGVEDRGEVVRLRDATVANVVGSVARAVDELAAVRVEREHVRVARAAWRSTPSIAGAAHDHARLRVGEEERELAAAGSAVLSGR